MPLIKRISNRALGENIAIERAAGKPENQAVAIAESVRRHLMGKRRLAEGAAKVSNNTPDVYHIVGDNLPETDYDKIKSGKMAPPEEPKKSERPYNAYEHPLTDPTIINNVDKALVSAKNGLLDDSGKPASSIPVLNKSDPEIDALVNGNKLDEMDKAPKGVPPLLARPEEKQSVSKQVRDRVVSRQPQAPKTLPISSLKPVVETAGTGTGINPVSGGIAAFRANNPSPLQPKQETGVANSQPVQPTKTIDTRSDFQKMMDQLNANEKAEKEKAEKEYNEKKPRLFLAGLLGSLGNGLAAYGHGPQSNVLAGFQSAQQNADKLKSEAEKTRSKMVQDYLMGKQQQSADIDLKNKQDQNDESSGISKQFQEMTGLKGSYAQIQPLVPYMTHLQDLQMKGEISQAQLEMARAKLQHTIDNDSAKNGLYAQRTAQMGHRAQQSEEHRVRGDFEKSFHDDVNDIDKRQRSIEMAHGILNGNIPITNELSASIATNLANADVGGRVAHQLQQDFKADTAEGNVAKFLQYFKNNPQDTKAKAIYNVMLKGMDNGLNEVKKGLHHRIQNAGYSDDQFKKYTGYDIPQSAQQSSAKPKQVTQNGHTYTLNEETGEYE